MYEKIVGIIANQLQVDPSRISEDTDIVEELGADSLDIVEMLMELEQNFSITIPDEEIIRFKTPNDILNYVEEQQK